MEEEVRRKLQNYITNCLEKSRLGDKSEEEIKKALKSGIEKRIEEIQDRIESTKFMTIKEGGQKKKEYKQKLEKEQMMIELFDEEYEKYRHKRERLRIARDELSNTIKATHQSMRESNTQENTQERIKQILEEASKKHPIPSKEDINKGYGIGD